MFLSFGRTVSDTCVGIIPTQVSGTNPGGRVSGMPRIAAPTVQEHHERVLAALIDAAETIMRSGGPGALTAAAVSREVGIARNSLYSYVRSVDELRGLVLTRHLPPWLAAVDAAVAGRDDARERLLAWARGNLDQAARSGHGWLMGIAREGALPEQLRRELADVHAGSDAVTGAWRELLGPGRPADLALLVAMTHQLVDAGFARLDAGDDAGAVTEGVLAALAAVIDARVGPDR